MVEIRLHGPLAKDFGKVWHLDVQSVQEAVQAIEANMAGFRRRIMDLAEKGMVFRVRTKNHDYDNDDVHMQLGSSIKRVDIIPLVIGASAGVRFVIGAILTYVGYVVSLIPGYNFIGMAMVSVGLSLMVGSVAEWLTPKATKPDGPTSLQSWTISGPTNTVDQGMPVPVIYGEVLTGGYVISGGISVSQIINGTSGPSVNIGGLFESADYAVSGNVTSSLKFGVASFNMIGPFSYAWSQTGFAGAGAVRLTGAITPAVELQVDFNDLVVPAVTTYTGSITVVVSGKNIDKSGDDVSATQTCAVTMSINTIPYEPTGSA